MGPSGDRVRVRERLPVPLFVFLGGGSDKFIGYGERDFCFPEGARRNRCIGTILRRRPRTRPLAGLRGRSAPLSLDHFRGLHPPGDGLSATGR
jgi:hypothetical protein